MIWQIFDERFVRACVYYPESCCLCYVCTAVCKSALVALHLVNVPLKRNMPHLCYNLIQVIAMACLGDLFAGNGLEFIAFFFFLFFF